jgi:ATP-binding cassette, subfamily B, bacterial
VNVKDYKRKSLQRQIGIVLHESVLFGATIQEIIAASAVNAHDFIMELEDGYATVIGERGATLSGGQRPRIVIARAVVRNARILILDEPMTGLGVESKAKVQEAIDRLMVGKTWFLITHDLHAVADADLVLVIEEGRIVERGTHGELRVGSERYHQLHELKVGRHEESVRER